MDERIYYNKNKNIWVAYVNIDNKEKTIEYSVDKYGEYAKQLALLTLEMKERQENIIELKNNYAIIKTLSPSKGWYEIKVDLEDIDKVKDVRWGLNEGYAYNFSLGAMHRYILDLNRSHKNHTDYVDHINRDKLDNRKSNLRITDNSGNQKNKGLQSNNTSGVSGVRYTTTATGCGWMARVSTNNGKRISKFFSENKYGIKESKQLAIRWRNEKMIEYGYIIHEESSTTTESE